MLAGFFSAQLRKHQVRWLPCEIEALGIAAAVKHFAPYIAQFTSTINVLTDSKPCVQAFEKLSRGEFSASPRVTTFLSTISRYSLTVRHLAGSANLPSDFASRNAPTCSNDACQVCSFVSRLEEVSVRQVTVSDIMSGSCRLPFTGRSAWLSSQQDCHDLRRVKAHLSQGTRPSHKQTKIRDVKRYLQVTSLARDGLLVVRRSEAFSAVRECIVVPRQVVPGLLCALHLRFQHPSQFQLKQLFSRYFYALDLDAHLSDLYGSCHACAALKRLPPPLVESSTSAAPAVGVSYAADVMHYCRQLVLVVRETVTSHTLTCFVDDERATTLEQALISLCVALRAVDGPLVTVRVDPAPGFVALSSREALKKVGIALGIGRIHNPNKNPCAEHAIGELRGELKRVCPGGGPLSSSSLAIATSRLNSRLRHGGLSAFERLLSRDQYDQTALSVSDRELIAQQHSSRLENHPHDFVSKSRSVTYPTRLFRPAALCTMPATATSLLSVPVTWCRASMGTGAMPGSSPAHSSAPSCISFTGASAMPCRPPPVRSRWLLLPLHRLMKMTRPPSPHHRRRVPSPPLSLVVPLHSAPAPRSPRAAIGAMPNCLRSSTILLSPYARSGLCLFAHCASPCVHCHPDLCLCYFNRSALANVCNVCSSSFRREEEKKKVITPVHSVNFVRMCISRSGGALVGNARACAEKSSGRRLDRHSE